MAQNHHKGQARMFKSDFIEFFSKVHPATPAVVYGPFVCFCLYTAGATYSVPIVTIAWQFVVGWVVWTLSEYWLHRLLFHIPVKGKVTKAIYWYLHGVHHDYPWDYSRLVMPLFASALGAALFSGLFYLLFGTGMWPFTGGFTFGYILYDTAHWYTHAGRPKNKFLKFLRKEHMVHHFKEGADNSRFGVSCPWWDVVFGTTGKTAEMPSEAASSHIRAKGAEAPPTA